MTYSFKKEVISYTWVHFVGVYVTWRHLVPAQSVPTSENTWCLKLFYYSLENWYKWIYIYIYIYICSKNHKRKWTAVCITFHCLAKGLRHTVKSSYLLTYLLTYSHTARCRVLLEKLTGLQLVKKFPAFHRTRRFITALTSVRLLSLSWASPIQSIYPHPTSCRSILILPTHLCVGLPSGLFPSSFPTKTLYTPSPHLYAPHAQPISFFSILSSAHYWVSSTNHLAPRYAISSIPPLPRHS